MKIQVSEDSTQQYECGPVRHTESIQYGTAWAFRRTFSNSVAQLAQETPYSTAYAGAVCAVVKDMQAACRRGGKR